MSWHCIICGREKDANFLYRVKDMTICLCTKHMGDYVNKINLSKGIAGIGNKKILGLENQ